jgi:hypothetical protein
MNIRVAKGQQECLCQGALSDNEEWTALPYLVQLHLGSNRLPLWSYRSTEGRVSLVSPSAGVAGKCLAVKSSICKNGTANERDRNPEQHAAAMLLKRILCQTNFLCELLCRLHLAR